MRSLFVLLFTVLVNSAASARQFRPLLVGVSEHASLDNSTGEIVKRGPNRYISVALSNRGDPEMRELVVAALQRIARATNLLKLSAQVGAGAFAQTIRVLESRRSAQERPK